MKKKEIQPNNYCEVRSIYINDFRNLCVSHNWYTSGSIEEYSIEEYTVLLEIVAQAENVTTAMIHEWAVNIKNHSITEFEITDIMFEIARICSHHFYKI